jgi:small-conductance mechanosensitive channel
VPPLTAVPSASLAASDVGHDVQGFVVPVLAILAAVVAAYVVATLVAALVGRMAQKSSVAADLSRRSRRPLRAVLFVIAIWIALRLSTDPADWTVRAEHVLLIALIITVTWLIGSLAFVLEDTAVQKYRIDVADNQHARRIRTQVQVLRRITVAILVVCAIAGILLTFPSARALGASLLASAGVISIVAGLAAQSSLANVFAGLQLAFTDAIRVDDVVVVDLQWGRIEEITLTYVVVHIWDDRRLILPSTYFTTTPFENWTRRAADLLGTVELDLDWDVPVDAMRAELVRLLEHTDLWDRRVGVLQVTDAVGGHVRVRALASAVDAPTLFDLRCYVREGLVVWLQDVAPQAIPRTRWEGTAPVAPETRRARREDATSRPTPVLPRPGAWSGNEADNGTADDTMTISTGNNDARLFTGSIEALERSRHFSGPGQEVMDEREQSAQDHGEGRPPA